MLLRPEHWSRELREEQPWAGLLYWATSQGCAMLPSPRFGLACDSGWCKTLTVSSFQAQLSKKCRCSLSFLKGGKRHEAEVWPWLDFSSPGCFFLFPGTQWWRLAYFCLCAKSRSPWQAVYLPDRTMKDWHRKETFFPAKVLVHVYSTSVFLFSESHLPSECNQSPWGLRNKGKQICFTCWMGHEGRTRRLFWA